MRRLLFLVIAGVAAGFSLVGAQGPAVTDTLDLPIRRVVLYKSGIGFFEHVGKVAGNQRISVPFTSTQLDDVLKTLTVLDLDGGAVSSVGYNTDAPIEKQLDAIGLPISGDASLADMLRSFRGARVDISRGGAAATGRLLGVDTQAENRNGAATEVDYVSVLSEGGAVHTFELGPATSVHFADPNLGRRVDQYLAKVAAAFDSQRRALNILATGSGTRRVYVSYISEAPVWKATYRVVLPSEEGAKPMLQGWAIVDNTGSTDWTNVELSLVAGTPQSFRQPISQPMYLRRPEIPMSQALLAAPQAFAGALLSPAAANGVVTDTSGAVLPGVAVRVFDPSGVAVGAAVTDAAGHFTIPEAHGHLSAEFMLPGFRTQRLEFEAGNELRVALDVGSVSEAVEVTATRAKRSRSGRVYSPTNSGAAGGIVGGMASPIAPPPPSPAYLTRATATMEQAATRELGDLFEYKLKAPVTIPRSQSAMVPIVSSPMGVERVSVWSQGELGVRPRRALWITNTTGLTLDAGSVTVIDHESFAGEGLIETLKAGEKRLLTYAVDLGMQVDAAPAGIPGSAQRLRIARGIVNVDTMECSQTLYTIRNDDTTPRQLVIEQSRREGWKLIEGRPAPAETAATVWRFLVPVAAKATGTLTVASYRPVQSSMSLSGLDDDQLALYLKNGSLDESGRAALSAIVDQKAALVKLTAALSSKDDEAEAIADDQERIRKNMTSLKGSTEEKELLQRYVTQLNDQEDRLKLLTAERKDLEHQSLTMQQELDGKIQSLVASSGSGALNPCGPR